MTRNTLLSIGTALVITALAVPATGQECYRSTACKGAALCIDLSCVGAEGEVEKCNDAGDCEEWNEICHDGFCKPDGVLCENPAGHCVVGDGWGECGCEDGMGTGWTDDSDPDEPADPIPLPTGEEQYLECVESLEMTCGTEEPDIAEHCDEDALAVCEDLVSKWHELEENCGWNDGDEPDETDPGTGSGDGDSDGEVDGDPPPDSGGGMPSPPPEEPSFAELRDCCEELEEPEMEEFLDCMMEVEADDCEGAEECDELWGEDGEPAGGDGDGDADYEDDKDNEGSGADGDADADSDADGDTDRDAADGGAEAEDDGSGAGTGCAVSLSTPSSSLFEIVISIF